MEAFSALLALCAGKSPVTGEFPAQRPVTRSFDVFFDLRPNKLLSNCEAGDFIHHRTHYDVTVMIYGILFFKWSFDTEVTDTFVTVNSNRLKLEGQILE